MKLLDRLNAICLAIASAAILVMTVAGGLDVVSTAFLGQPIAGVYEATEALMVVVIFLALGFLQASGGNIAVDILTARLPPGPRVAQVALAEFFGLVFFGLMAWQGLLLAIDSWNIGEYSAGLVRFPLYPAKFALAFGAALTALCCAARLATPRRTAAITPHTSAHAD